MTLYYNSKDILIRLATSVLGLERRMFKGRKSQVTLYQNKNIALKKCKCLLLGDSHTFGLNKYLEDDPAVVNIGINGDTTKGLLERYEENIASIQPDIAILQIGYNDFKYRSVRQTLLNYKKLLSRLEKNDKVFICSLFPVIHHRTIINKKIQWFNKELISICAGPGKLTYINIFDLLYDKEINGLNPLYTYDGVHLNDEGYKFYLDSIGPIIN